VDNITHSLFALTLANAGLRRTGRGSVATLVIASNIPDIEILTTVTGGRVAYLAAHRGPTHGLLGLALAVATAAVVWGVQRWRGQPRDDTASFLSLTGIAAIGVLGHIAMDFCTSYGTRIFSPFVNAWFGVDWLPIFDIFLLLILGSGLVASYVRPQARARIAAVVLLLAAGHYAFRAALHVAALQEAQARQNAAFGAVASNGLPRTVFSYLNRAQPSALPAALPTPFSPFRWRLITRAPGRYVVSEVNLLAGRTRHGGGGVMPTDDPDSIWFPDESTPMVHAAATAPLARVFLDFARFPAAEVIRHRNGDATVHWYDIRFGERPALPGDGRRHTSPFGVWVRLSPAGAMVGQGLGPG
jgi:membrane-bound metal-dependent hydrolase YbcI (DUF457 family)